MGGTHENLLQAVTCRSCDFLVRGARIGNYEVVDFLGTGSYGHVYKVQEPVPLSRVLALKVLRVEQLTEKARDSFFDEARRIANLQHPNILPVYNFGQLIDGRPYLVMEYAPQTILNLFLNPDGTRRLAFAEELLPYVEQASSALFHIHEDGLIHQDIKPGNLLIGRKGQLLLSDFGATFYLGMQTHASLGEVTGTAAYMPPEQWQGNPRRHSDQYALAICFYELLAGRPPFLYHMMEQMWNAHLKEPPPQPQQWNPRVPAEVGAVLLRAMAKNYQQRYYTVVEFADSYSKALSTALKRYVCQNCEHQNRTGARRCNNCGASYDERLCPFCDTPVRFGQRCCAVCGRLTTPSIFVPHSQVAGVSVAQDRYLIKHVLTDNRGTNVLTSLALDTQRNDERVILKRWKCTALPLARRERELTYYEQASTSLANLKHPLVPHVLDRFVEGRHYYLVLNYIPGESLEERLQKLLRPVPEREIIGYMNTLLNVLIALEQMRPPLRHYDISPANIIIEQKRERPILTGFQLLPPPPEKQDVHSRHRTTLKINSPYLPIKDAPFDQRTCIYMLAASMHHALTNNPPPHYPTYPPARTLNPDISPELERILSLALMEDAGMRYQSYGEMQRDLKRIL
jgi:eukaryotic-like serine/threonine-protein kinase